MSTPGLRPGQQVDPPDRRRLRAFAFDPMTSRLTGRTLTLSVPWEPLHPGPAGRDLIVVDFDPVRDIWYEPVDLNDGAILAQDGLAPSEADPRSHQQIVYAVCSSVMERVQRFMGRSLHWRKNGRLRVVPHAFEGANAYFDPGKGLLFGYYRADLEDPGPNLPGQTIFTCLSNDIVAHELTHAIVHRFRRYYQHPTNPDVFAIHEGVADLVALFHHFVDRDTVHNAIASTSGDIEKGTGLFDLASEFGYATGRGAALRQAIIEARPKDADPIADYQTPAGSRELQVASEPHERGVNFVMGVFDAYLDTYRDAIADLIRIATQGTGVLPPGRLHPDLVARLTDEAIKNADRLLGMVIRAFDYMPVVDPTFGDLVRAIVTADHDLYPDDERRLRARLVESLRRRGIHAPVAALTDEALIWPAPERPFRIAEGDTTGVLADVMRSETLGLKRMRDLPGRIGTVPGQAGVPAPDGQEGAAGQVDEWDDDEDVVPAGEPGVGQPAGQERLSAGLNDRVRVVIGGWAGEHADELGLDSQVPVNVTGIHVSYRLASDGQPRPEMVVQLDQLREDLAWSNPDGDQIVMRAGTTVIATADGLVKYLVKKPLPALNHDLAVDPTAQHGQAPPADGAAAAAAALDPGTRRLAALTGWLQQLQGRRPGQYLGHRVRLRTHEFRDPARGRLMAGVLTVRMYNVGFGDCFLITVETGTTRWRMLVDCGVHPQGQVRDIELVVQQLIADLSEGGDPRIDVVVATHRHADHVSGFAVDDWASVEVGEVWLPYVEDEDDPDGRRLRKSMTDAARGLENALTTALAASPRDAPTLALARELALNALPNQPAMDRLLKLNGREFASPHRIRYFPDAKPRKNVISPTPGVRLHVLGPSRDPEDLKRMDPPKKAGWLSLTGDTEPIGSGQKLFQPRFEVDGRSIPDELDKARKDSALRGLLKENEPGLLAAAVRLDRVVNNTSIFLVLQVGDVSVILPGDSQQGAWEHVLRSPTNVDLLEGAALYKIGHHGSHNATPKPFVEHDWHPGGYAMLPWGRVERWKKIPKPTLMAALAAHHKIVRVDQQVEDHRVEFGPDDTWSQVTLAFNDVP